MGSEEGQTRSGVKKTRSKSIRESRSGVARGKQKEASHKSHACCVLVSRVNFTPSVHVTTPNSANAALEAHEGLAANSHAAYSSSKIGWQQSNMSITKWGGIEYR